MKFVLAVALASIAAAVPVTTSHKWTPRALQGLDFELINLARNLESLELNYFNQGLQNFTDQDFANAGYPGFRTYLRLFRDQEITHFVAINEAAGGNFQNCTYTFPVTNPKELITVAQVVTTVGEGAFIGALGIRQQGASIVGNEARQNSYLRQLLGLDYFNAVNFDTSLTASQAYSLAKPFFSCPSSNPPINFKLIPPLMASFASGQPGQHRPGDQVNIKWDASKFYLGNDVHIQWLGDVNSVSSELRQSGSGKGTTTLPQGLNGTAILVATNYDGGGPIPDGQNFAIGYVVVA